MSLGCQGGGGVSGFRDFEFGHRGPQCLKPV